MIKRLLAFALLALSLCAAHAQNITVYSSGNVARGGARQLSAYVPLSPNTITWSVNGVAGGDATFGTVSSAGLYQAPAVIPAGNVVAVRATSTAYPAQSGEVALTITQPQVQLWSVSPSSVPAGNFTISLNGSNFTAGSVVQVGGVAVPTTFVSSTRLGATGVTTAAQAGTSVSIKVVNTGIGATTSSGVNLAITAPVVVPPPPPPVVAVTPTSASVETGKAQQFTASVTGAANTAVVWSVNTIAGGNSFVGTITAGGLYTAPAAVPSPAGVTVRATSVVNATASATASVAITQPPGGGLSQGTPNLAAGRFLEQAAFGPTPAALAHVNSIGIDAWLDEQFAMGETPIASPGGMNLGAVQAQHLHRLATAPDQLRQRMVTALGGIIVISANKNIYPEEIVPYLQILSKNAFGNYRTLLEEIARSPQMGKYLDHANSNKPTPGSAANENFGRELMQLFTIGLYALNPDGSRQLQHPLKPDGMPDLAAPKIPIRAYDQGTVQQVSLALTGWTFAGPANNNWENFSGPLQSRVVNHDLNAKTLVGAVLPAGQTPEADLTGTLDWLFNHPNIAPFVSMRLIRAFVKSNPSAEYIGRVSAVFAGTPNNVRGDLQAVVRAILTDPEARDDVPVADSGRLKDPIYNIVAFVRALGGSISPTNQQAWPLSRMSQAPLAPSSVFGFYSPLFRMPRSSLIGPEFQIYGPTESVLRGNLFWQIISHPGSDFPVSIAPFVNAAGNTVALIDAVDQALLYGRMPTAMRQSLANAINAQGDAINRAQTALYLTALSGFYAVQF